MAARCGRSCGPFHVVAALALILVAIAGVAQASGVRGFRSIASATDTVPPATTVLLSGPTGYNGWYTGPVTITLNATDDGTVAGTYFQLDTGAWTTYAGPFTVSPDGYHALQFYSDDAAGNNETVHTIDFAIDSIPPGTSVTVLGIWNATSLEYTGTVGAFLEANDSGSGVGTIWVQVDRGPWVGYGGALNLSAAGLHLVNYSAEDVAGNREAVAGVLVPVDVPYPGPMSFATLSGTAGQGGWYVSAVRASLRAVSLPGVAAAPVYRIDAGPWQVYNGSFLIGDGRHSLAFGATGAPNLTVAPGTQNVLVDQAPPMTGCSLNGTEGNGSVYVSNVTVGLTAMDATSGVASTAYALDSGAWQPYVGPFTLGEGHHTVLYRSVDRAGNQEAVSTVSLQVDTEGPRITDLAPAGVLTQSSVELSWDATDPAVSPIVFAVSVDGAPFQPIGSRARMTVSLSDGDHYVVVRATNAVGLSAVAVTSFRVDTNPFSPTGPLSGFPLYLTIVMGIGLLGLAGAAHRRPRPAARRISKPAGGTTRRAAPVVHPPAYWSRAHGSAEERYVPFRTQPFRPPGVARSTASRRR